MRKLKLFMAACALLAGSTVASAAALPTSGSGEFFLKNVGTGTYLKGDAYYGTKAVVWNDPYAVTLTYVSDGVYTIKSQQNNGGENQYFGNADDMYVDQGAANMTFTEVDTENHYYTIANAAGNLYAMEVTEDGAKLYKVMAGAVSTDYAKWQVISRAELAEALDAANATTPVDATFFIKDAGIDVKSVNASSWSLTNVDLAGGGNAGHSAESWSKANFSMSQTVTGLPNGKYRATCYGYYRWNNSSNNNNSAAVTAHGNGTEVLNAIFFAGTKETPLMSVAGDANASSFCQTQGWTDNTPNNQWQAAACFTQGFYLNTIDDIVVTDGTLTIGVKKTTQAGTDWAVFDEFKLYYLGEDLSIYQDAYNDAVSAASAVDQTAPMNGNKLSALQSAISSYGTGVDTNSKDALIAATTALNTATANAKASIDAYVKANIALTGTENILNGTNFYTSAAAETFKNAMNYTAGKEAYDNRTLTDENANTLVNPEATTGWRAANNVDDLLMSVWDETPEKWDSYHVNTWSTEGDTDGSNFKVPFTEYWTGNDGSLGAKTLTASISGLENGQYKVEAWVRVRAKDGTSATDATGISMQVNAGDAVDVTEGTQIGSTQLTIKEYEAFGLVKDGILVFKFDVADGNNISWLSFKNVNYTKVRDLTPEEAAIVPTAIELNKTSVELTATNNTETLTLSFTPADATNTVTWTSSDPTVATVADGVVTGVSTGTATITVTSTLDATVKAEATVTVTFPETAVATEDVVVDGPAMSTVTYGNNLIKNGSFEYANSFYGWSVATGAAMSADNFNLVADGDNHYITAKGHTGAGGVNSIGTAWTIEAGKTYVFGYKVKSTSAGISEFHKVTLTNTVGTETKQISDNATPVTTDWTEVKYKFTNTDGYAYIQFRARWLNSAVSFDDFYLLEVTSESNVGNVAYAQNAIPTANIGTGAFQYSQNAIDAANALVQGTATVAEVEAAYEAVTTVNAPADGQLFNVILTYGGWTYDNKAMTYLANGRTDAGLYNIQYKEAANQNLAQAFTFTKVSGNDYKMSQIDADGNVRYICTGTPYGGNNQQIRTTTNADDALVLNIRPTATEGIYNLYNTAQKDFIGSQDAGVYTVNSHIDFKLVETTKPSITINTTAAGWGTTILPFAVASLPTDVKAYTSAAVDGESLTLV